jgi:hypothetical protein
MKTFYRNIQLSVIALIIPVFLMECGKPDVKPAFSDPAYKTKLLLNDRFDQGLGNWMVYGLGRAETTTDSSLELATVSDTIGISVWSRLSFPENFQLEYDLFIQDTAGTHTVYFCAEGEEKDDFESDRPISTRMFNDFIRNRLNSYQIFVHCYDRTGKIHTGTKLRKNPGNLLLSGSPVDPCRDNRKYLIDVMKIGSRIKLFVDGEPVHDVRDRGGFGPVYSRGRIGFMIQGRAGAFRIQIDNVRVFELTPR